MSTVLSSSKPIWQQAIDAMNVEAWELRDTELERSRSGVQEVLVLAKRHNYQKGVARALVVSSYYHYRQGHLDSALDEASKALSSLEEPQDTWLPRVYNNLSMVHMDIGNTSIALEYLYKQLFVSQQQKDHDMEATAYHDLGWVFARDEKRLPEAIDYFERALTMFREVRHPGSAEIALLNLAGCFISQENYQKAKDYAYEAIDAANEGRAWGAHAYQVLGKIDLAQGDYPQALEHLLKALDIAQKRELGQEPRVLLLIGQCQNKLAQPEEARERFLQALESCRGQGNKLFLPDCHFELASFYKSRGEFEKALEHFAAFYHCKEAIANESLEQKRSALEVFYRTETIKREAELHQKQNLELKTYIQELEQLHQEVKELSVRDHLTSLYNRRYLFDYLELLKNRAEHLSLAIIDIDHFKSINDRFTHSVGDQVLKGIATFLGAFSRETDIAARYGGEEFVVVFPEASLEQALLACERLRATIETHAWDQEHPDLSVTLSIGLVSGRAADYEKLLVKADQKLYQAKRDGRNCVRY